MNQNEMNTSTRQAATNGLAVVGFIALVALGIWLAVYSARYIPIAADQLGAAAVSLSQIFTPAVKPTLTVIPTASTTISFNNSTSTPESTPTIAPKKQTPAAPKTVGDRASGTYPMSGTTTATASLFGFPDLVINIKDVGYLATTSAESFVASSTVPVGSRPAVTFTIKNVGTNATGAWRFSASIPANTAYIYQSQLQPPLNPGDSIDYTLGFDQANKGADKMISITANFDRAVTESNPDNNSASTKITILGS